MSRCNFWTPSREIFSLHAAHVVLNVFVPLPLFCALEVINT